MSTQISYFATCLLLVAASPLCAEPREWTSSDGMFKVEAELLSFDGRIARLKKSDGTVIEVPWENFCEADANFLERRTVEPRATLTGHKYALSCVAISPNGKILASAGGGSGPMLVSFGELILWNPISNARIDVLPSQGGYVRALAFSPDSKLLVASYESGRPGQPGRTVVWSIASRKPQRTIEFAALGVDFSKDGNRLALGGTEMTPLRGLGAAVAGSTGAIKVWDVDSGREIATLKDANPMAPLSQLTRVSAVAFLPNGKTLASSNSDGKIKLWDVAAGAITTTLTGAGTSPQLSALAISPDGDVLAYSSQTARIGQRLDDVTLCNAKTGEVIRRIVVKRNVNSIAFSHNGRMLAVGTGLSDDGDAFLFDPNSAELTSTLRGHTAPVRSVAFTQDDKTLATVSSDKSVKLWSVPPWLSSERAR